MSDLKTLLAIAEMRKQGDKVLYCRHVDELEGAPSCCSSCHIDEDLGYENLYDEATDDIEVNHHLCCAKREWLTDS